MLSFMPKSAKGFIKNFLPKPEKITISAEERDFVRRMLASETGRFNEAIGEELYIP